MTTIPFVSARHDGVSAATRSVIEPFIDALYLGRDVRGAFLRHVHPDYAQHNPGIADGREAAITALAPMFADPDFHADLERVIVDGDFAVIHLHGYRTGKRGGAVVDMYRVRQGLIVEHWDIIQDIPEHSTNNHPMF